MNHLPTPTELREQLDVDVASASNIHSLLRLAAARGRCGRWPEQRFEDASDWQTDGDLIDRVALLAGLHAGPVLALYIAAHAVGLRAAS